MRKMGQFEVMLMVANNWHRHAPFTESVRSTAGFLWVLVLVLILGSSVASIIALWPKVEHHGCQGANASSNVEQAQCAEADGAGRRGGHATQPEAAAKVSP